MADFRNNTKDEGKKHLKKWGEWQGDWQSYLRYMEKHGWLSSKFEDRGGVLQLQPGYNPPWGMNDYK